MCTFRKYLPPDIEEGRGKRMKKLRRKRRTLSPELVQTEVTAPIIPREPEMRSPENGSPIPCYKCYRKKKRRPKRQIRWYRWERERDQSISKRVNILGNWKKNLDITKWRFLFFCFYSRNSLFLTSCLKENAILYLRYNRCDNFRLENSRHDRRESQRIGISRGSTWSIRVPAIDRRASLHDLRFAEKLGRGWLVGLSFFSERFVYLTNRFKNSPLIY